jgi:hypothetical protein
LPEIIYVYIGVILFNCLKIATVLRLWLIQLFKLKRAEVKNLPKFKKLKIAAVVVRNEKQKLNTKRVHLIRPAMKTGMQQCV